MANASRTPAERSGTAEPEIGTQIGSCCAATTKLSARLRATAPAADVVVAEGDSLMVGVRLGEGREGAARPRQAPRPARLRRRQRSAILSTADFTRRRSTSCRRRRGAGARHRARIPFSGLPGAAELAHGHAGDRDLFDPAVGAVTAEQATEWCKEGEAAARDADPRITNSEGAEFDAGSHLVVYAASNGFHGELPQLELLAVGGAGGVAERRHGARPLVQRAAPRRQARTPGRDRPHRRRARPAPPRRAQGRHLRGAGGVRPRHGRQPAAPPGAGAVSGNALYKGMSFLTGKLGERIAPPFITVYDDGTLPGGLGSKPFDGEGLPTRRTAVVESGVLTSYLFDTYSGRKMAEPLDRQRLALGRRLAARQPDQSSSQRRHARRPRRSSARSSPASTSPS